MMKYDSFRDYDASDIIEHMKEVIKARGPFIAVLLGIYVTVNIFTMLILQKKYISLMNMQNLTEHLQVFRELGQIFDLKYFLTLLLSTLCISLILVLLTRMTANVVLRVKENRYQKSIIIQYLHYLIMYLAYFAVFFVIGIVLGLVSLIFVLIPILGILIFFFLMIGLFVFYFYFAGYYRFIPYIAVFDFLDGIFGASKRYIKNHLGLSIFVLIFFMVINCIISVYIQTSLVNNQIVTFVILSIISTVFVFTMTFFDIAFVITGYKREYLEYKENEMKKQGNEELNQQTEEY